MTSVTHIIAGITLLSTGCISASAMAKVTDNIGFASEYHFRGVFQNTSLASAGVDFESGGFYEGIWTSDVGDGVKAMDLDVGIAGSFASKALSDQLDSSLNPTSAQSIVFTIGKGW